jgi:transposase
MKNDPLYKARRTLHTGDGLLTDAQIARLEALFADEQHVAVEATWGIYQRMIAAYREPDKKAGKQAMQGMIDAITSGVPAALYELRRLGRTRNKRAADILASDRRPDPVALSETKRPICATPVAARDHLIRTAHTRVHPR